MKKILQINSVLNIGSTGRIAEELGNIAIRKGWDSYIAYGREMGGVSLSKVIKIGKTYDIYKHVFYTRFFDGHAFGSRRATKHFIKEIDKIQPDVIVLHNLHGYYINIEILFQYLKKLNKPVFWILYDCWAFTGHCAYFDMLNCDNWQSGCTNCPCKESYPKSFVNNSQSNYAKKAKIFLGMDKLKLIVHSQWLADTIKLSFLNPYPIWLIRNGINLDNFKPFDSKVIKDRFNIHNKFIILGVANVWEKRKGFEDFLSLSHHLKEDEVILMDGLSSAQIQRLPKNIISVGSSRTVRELAELYSGADVFLNPTYEDNFPTTNIEALACGTPVITYNSGGSPEAIDANTGFVCEKGDIEAVYAQASIIKNKGKSHYTNYCRNRAEKHYNFRERYAECVDLFEG